MILRIPKKAAPADPQPVLLEFKAHRGKFPYAEEGQVPVWGQSWKKRTGPKSDRPKWEKILGVTITYSAWGTIKKREHRGRTIDAQSIMEVLRLRGEIA